MKNMVGIFIFLFIFNSSLNSLPRYSFMQANNINTIFMNNGIYNYDKITFPGGDAGFIWPAASLQRLTADFATGIYLVARVNGSFRSAGSLYASHFTGGNIPVIGQVPPSSVCSDSAFRVYLVSLTDQSLVNGGVRTYNAGGRQYTLNFTSWTNWPINQGAPYFESNGIPGYQPGWNSDRPSIGNGSNVRPDQLLFTVYMDYTNCTNNIHDTEVSLPGGTLPIGVEIQQISFAFNCSSLENTYFTKYRLINKSSYNWDSVYLGLVNDVDLGTANDDAGGCDSLRNFTFIYNADNQDQSYGSNPPALGTRLLQSPIKFTGISTDTVRLPYDTLIGYRFVYQTGSIIFRCGSSCFCQPGNLTEAYNLLKGLDRCGKKILNYVTGNATKFMYSGDACSRTGWYDSSAGDKSYLQSSGPFNINSGDTQLVVYSFMVSRSGGNFSQNVCTIQALSDSARKYYYNNFVTCIPIGINPISTEVPERFILYQNYPNPFNPTTKIKFALPPSSLDKGLQHLVQLKVFDILGREITTLVNEQLSPGTYEVEWDGTNYSSGVYYYRLVTDNFSDTKKMLIVK